MHRHCFGRTIYVVGMASTFIFRTSMQDVSFDQRYWEWRHLVAYLSYLSLHRSDRRRHRFDNQSISAQRSAPACNDQNAIQYHWLGHTYPIPPDIKLSPSLFCTPRMTISESLARLAAAACIFYSINRLIRNFTLGSGNAVQNSSHSLMLPRKWTGL